MESAKETIVSLRERGQSNDEDRFEGGGLLHHVPEEDVSIGLNSLQTFKTDMYAATMPSRTVVPKA